MLGGVLRVLVAASAACALAAAPASAVVGGDPIQVSTAPWTVYVQDSSLLCTGAVIDASHVLTAAHCVYNGACQLPAPSAFQVRAGVSNYSSRVPNDQEQDRGVSSYRIHPGYTCSEHAVPDDVAVLALSSPLDLSGPSVGAIDLPQSGTAFPAADSVGIAGFGRQQPTVTASGQLAWMTAIVDSQGACGENGLIEGNAVLLCASSPTSAVCKGDSGSGLVTTGSASPVLVGVADATIDGCSPGSHSVFAWTGAPEILQFIQGDDQPPTAPRETNDTFLRLGWTSSGPIYAGDTLTCSTGRWSDPAASVSYAFVDSVSGNVLQSGAKTTLVVPASAVGASIVCRAALTNAGGTTLAETNAAPAVRPAPVARIVRVAPVTASRGRVVSIRVTLVAPEGIHGRLAVCVRPPKLVAGRLCRSTVDGDGLPSTVPFIFTLRVKATAPLGTAQVAINAVAGQSTVSTSTVIRVTG
jgi:hypothetical protein